jgi:hypothetical protein
MDLTDDDAVKIAEVLKTNKKVVSLNLSCMISHSINVILANKIGDKGAEALAQALKVNSTLESLSLGRIFSGFVSNFYYRQPY